MFKLYIEIAHKFGKSTGYGILMIFFGIICIPMLAFGKNNVYEGGTGGAQLNPIPTTEYNPQAVLQQGQNNIENNNSNTVMPPMFDQNINTQINPIPQIQETPVAPTPIINPQPEMNATPIMEPANNIPNEVNVNQPDNGFTYNPTMNQPIEQPIVPPMNNEPMVAQVIPTPVEPQQNVNIIPNPQPVTNPEPTLNVIPGMGNTQEPIIPTQNPGNNPNNINM